MPTFIGKPVTVAEDKQLQVGNTLRDFNLTATDLLKNHFQNSMEEKSYLYRSIDRYWYLFNSNAYL